MDEIDFDKALWVIPATPHEKTTKSFNTAGTSSPVFTGSDETNQWSQKNLFFLLTVIPTDTPTIKQQMPP